MKMMFSPVLIAAGFGITSAAHGADPFKDFLKKHCIACHGLEKNQR